MTNRIRKGILPLAIASLLAAPAVMAQNVTSSAVTGVVTDASGQPVEGATVTIVNEPSGTTRVVTTGKSGRYNAQGLRVGGPYDITVAKAGMTQSAQNNVFLQLGQVSAINLKMASSEANAQNLGAVTVSASALAQEFSPDNKGLSTNISQRELEAMPTPGRDIQDVVRMDPRVVISDRQEGKISAMGQNYRYNNITVDSVGANDSFGLNSNGLPTDATPISQDTIAEYNISTANYDVTNRRGLGANVNAVTKSGTNHYHGSVYYVYQPNDWVGKNEDGQKYTGFDRQWTGGATLGGPIVKDKLFFFASYEKSNKVGAGSSVGPEGSGATTEVRGLTQADINHVIDIAHNKWGMKDLGDYTGGNSNLTDKRYLLKLDWNISNNHRASFTYNRTKETKPQINGSSTKLVLNSGWVLTNTDSKSYALHLYDDWTENFSTATTVSYAHYKRGGGPYNGVDLPDVSVHIGNFRGPSVEFGTNYSYGANQIDTKSLYASWVGTYFIGDHAIKGGIDYSHDKKYNLFLQDWFGSYGFDSEDDFENGVYDTYFYNRPADGLSLNDVAAAFTLKDWGVFLQDTWQVTDNLSVQYGLRLDVPRMDDAPLFNPTFANAGFVTSTGQVLTTNQYTVNNKRAPQPRMSFNYQFDTERMMQLHGGAGLFITTPPAVWIGNIYSNTGMNSVGYECGPRESICNTDLPAFSPDPHNQPDGTGSTSGQMTVNTVDPNFHMPSAWKFTLGYDIELPWQGIIASLDYEHIKNRDAIWYQDLNLGAPTGTLPDGRNVYYKDYLNAKYYQGRYDNQTRANANPDFTSAIINLANTSKGHADNISLMFRRPFQNGWSARAGVSWNHTTDVNPGLSSVAMSSYKQQFVTNPNENVASISNYNTAWRVIAGMSWRHAFFGDYFTSVSAFYDGHTGHPYSWAFGNDANGDSFVNDLVYIPNKGDVEFADGVTKQQISQFYDYIQNNKYLSKHQGEIARRNGAHARWLNQLDLSLSQEIPGIFKGNKGVIRVDIYNFLNMLDKSWGIEKRANFPGERFLADYYGVDPKTGKYIYDISGSNYIKDGNYKPQKVPTYVDFGDDLAQRWSVQVTLRYKF